MSDGATSLIAFRVERVINLLLACFVVAGLYFLFSQYFSDRSAWGDETMVGFNILSKSYSELLDPLDFNQVAPPLFLWVEKFFVDILGVSDLNLRILPISSSLITAYLLYLLLRILDFKLDVILIVLCFCFLSENVIYYASEIKQYSTDALVATSLACSAIYFSKGRLRYTPFVVLGAVSIYLSHIAIILLTSIISYSVVLLFYGSGESKLSVKKLMCLILIWVLSFVIYYFYFIYDHPHRNYMNRFWRHFEGLPPNRLGLKNAVVWLFSALTDYFSWSFRSYFNNLGCFIVVPLLCVSSFLALKRRHFFVLLLCIVPIFIHLCLALMRFYPFYTRLVLYAFPLLLIVIFYPINLILGRFSLRLRNIFIFFVFTPLLGLAVNNLHSKVPISKGRLNDIKSSLTEIKKLDIEGKLNIVAHKSVLNYYVYQKHLFEMDSEIELWELSKFEEAIEMGFYGHHSFFLPFSKRKQKELVTKLCHKGEFQRKQSEIDLYVIDFSSMQGINSEK